MTGAPTARLMLGGDVMLGRGVGEYIRRLGAAYPLEPIAPLMRRADLTIVNLECAITSSTHCWPGEPKAFYFGAPPEAIDTLTSAGIDLVSLANNHVLDFDVAGLRETCRRLRQHAVQYVGAGENLAQALSPAIIDCAGMRFGMAAFCDHQADFVAGKDRPGIAWIDLDDESATRTLLRAALKAMQNAAVDWPILSLHWGPNMVFQPSTGFRQLAHVAVDMGWKIIFGHSAHVFHGIEIHRGCPIFYACGDLVDDYYVDPLYQNDHQLLFELTLSRDTLLRIDLHPVFIEDCQTVPATDVRFSTIVEWMMQRCAKMGSHVQQANGQAWIEVACKHSGYSSQTRRSGRASA